MASRTRRNKVRFQAEKAQLKCDAILRHLQFLDQVAEGESDYINKNMPLLVKATEILREALNNFRSGL